MQVCWDKPDSLKSASELETASGEWVWVSDEEEGWVAARILSRNAASVQVQLQTGQRKQVNTKNVSDVFLLTVLLNDLLGGKLGTILASDTLKFEPT